MPTAAKMIAALCLAALGYLVSEAIKPLFPPETQFGIFTWVNVALGFFCGWTVVGPRAGNGWATGLSAGLTGGASLAVLGLLVQAVNEMVAQSLERRYDTALEAVGGVFEIAAEWSVHFLTMQVWAPLVAGSLVAGFLAEFAARRWR